MIVPAGQRLVFCSGQLGIGPDKHVPPDCAGQTRICFDSIEAILAKGLTTERLSLATEIARIPEEIRGYGHVKERHVHAAKAKWDGLMAQWKSAA